MHSEPYAPTCRSDISQCAIKRVIVTSIRALALERGIDDVTTLTDLRQALLDSAAGDATLVTTIEEVFRTEHVWAEDCDRRV